jgi:hypothetical protein
MISPAKVAKKLIMLLMLLTSLSPGCSHGVASGPFRVLQKPEAPIAVSEPRKAWKVENGDTYSLNKQDFESLRTFIIRQGEVIDIYECTVIAINGGKCER